MRRWWPWDRTPPRPTSARRRTARLAGGVVAVALVLAALAGLVLTVGLPLLQTELVSGEAPDIDAASTAPASQTTVVVAADGSRVGSFRPEELHVPVEPGEIPDTVAAAVVAAEDGDFWSHRGFDLQAAIRALLANTRAGQVEQGGSTITQQLAKNLFTDGDQTLSRKLEELRIAFAIEREHSKEEILAAYLNTTYFGEGAVGVGAAARTYFRKPLADVTLSEAALLAGLIPAPSSWNPRVDPAMAEERREVVLDRVSELDLAEPEEVEAARADQPVVQPARTNDARYPFFLDYVRRWLEREGIDPGLIYRGGLRVETTLDPRVQDAAIAALRRHLSHPHDPEGAVVVVDPFGGEVRALVGGRDWNRSQVNLALADLGGNVGRQPGSSFKPFVLAAALEEGVSPRDRVGAPRTYQPAGADQPVHNYSRRGYGRVTVAEATRRSINTSYVILTERLGPGRVAEVARDLGVNVPEPDEVGTSIGIGAYEVGPLGMAQAYAGFVRDGQRASAYPLQRVLDRRGDVMLEVPRAVEGDQVLALESARLVTDVLRGVVERGTGTRADFGRPAAGKTGTSDEYGNAWFVGYTPQLVASVWVGFPEGNIPMRDVVGYRSVSGGTVPAVVWHDVMVAAHEGLEVLDFPPAPDRPPSTTTTTAPPPPPETTQPPTTRPTTTTTTVPTTTTTAPPTTTTESTTTTTEPEPTTTTTEPEPTTTEPEPTTTTTTTTTVAADGADGG